MSVRIELEQMRLVLGGVEILRPISASMGPGALHAIVGPNGAGKSSFIKCLLGLLPHQGQIRRHWLQANQHIAYVPQQQAFEASLPITVAEYMALVLSNRPFFAWGKKPYQAQLEALLARVGLQDKYRLRLGQLSGGERQRLLFAQALAKDSLLWFVDEPMTGLDSQAQAVVTAELLARRQQGATLVVIHHDAQWIDQYADEIWSINGGLEWH